MIAVSLLIGIVGLLSILAAFAFNLFHFLSQKSLAYNILNILGSGFLAYYSWLLNSIPFLILQLVWALLSIIKLIHIVGNFGGKRK